MEKVVVLRIFKITVGIVGILGNGLVCVVIAKVSAMRTRSNAFIFHQAVVDLIGSTVILLRSEIPLPDPVPEDALGWIVCHVWFSHLALFFVYLISTLNLLMLTMERYFAIVHPLKYQAAFAKQPRLKVGVVIAACWIFTIIAKSYNITLFEVEDGACVSSAESRSKVLGVLTAMVHYVVPVTVMLFAYIRISVELKRRAARLQPALPPVDPTAGVSTADTARPINVLAASLLRARRNVFKMLLIVFVTFLICWTPNQVLFLMFNLGLPLRFDEWYILLSVAMVSANCCVNPLIYAFKYQQFRRGLREMFCHRRVGLHPDSSNPTNFIQAVR